MDSSSHLRRRLAASLVVAAMGVAACGADSQPVDDASGAASAAIQQGNAAVGVGPSALGNPTIGAPEVEQAVVGPPVPATVEVRYPDLVVRTPIGASQEDLVRVTAVEGVDLVAGVAQVGSAILLPGGGSHPVTVLAVDPATFRPLTPEVTANVPAVWERLREGDVLVRHDVAHQLGLELGGHIRVTGAVGELELRIGAFASNGAPPLADVIVPWDLRDDLGADDVNLLVVSVADDVSPGTAKAAIEQRVAGAQVTVRERPGAREASLAGGPGIRRFESFSYVDLGDGLIVIDGSWVRRWIVTVDLPYLGRTRCHRLMVPQLVEALTQVGRENLHGHLDRSQFAGCWVPRHIDWNPSKPLSMHAWGLAVDINSRDNCLGCRPTMHPRIVEIFRSWGFAWGGDWSRPDGMHFELERLIDVG